MTTKAHDAHSNYREILQSLFCKIVPAVSQDVPMTPC